MEDKDYKKFCWFLLGPTGIGKTFISLKIGQQFNNQIINTDAFSLYKEASIMTAKATKDEQKLVKHKMIDILDLFDVNYNQNSFKKSALNEINLIQNNGQIPLVVGGTNYFVESLLFNYYNELNNENNINDEYNPIKILELNVKNTTMLEKIKQIKKDNSDNNDICYTKLNEYFQEILNNKLINKDEIVNLLFILDNKSYNFYNKNDIRRIINNISYNISYEIRKSEILKNQKIKLNFDKSKVIILFPFDINALLKRITERIDTMIEEGFSEIIYIFNKFNVNKKEINFELGVLQSIGYKEFYELYKSLDNNLINDIYEFHLKEINNESNDNIINYNKNIIEEVINKNEKLKNVFDNCRNNLINNTLNYAKYQIKFIKKRILPYINNYQIIEIKEYSKDTYIKEYLPKIIDYLNNDDLIINVIGDINKNKIEDWKHYFCEICDCKLNGENEYNNHMKSNKHKKKKNKLNKKEKLLNQEKNIDKIEEEIKNMNINDKK